MAFIFDGESFVKKREESLALAVSELPYAPRLLSVVFDEDPASQLYTQLKAEAAARVGIAFERLDHSLLDEVPVLETAISQACERDDVHGVMIQKPTRHVWSQVKHVSSRQAFESWWGRLTKVLDPYKDVDVLSPAQLAKVYSAEWRLVPATVRAVLSVLEAALEYAGHYELSLTNNLESNIDVLEGVSVAVVGQSEIVGKPLTVVLKQFGAKVSAIDASTSAIKEKLLDAKVIVSATGRKKLIKKDMVAEDSIVIDVGSPGADVDFDEVKKIALFITPVPNGVGPVTVVSLMQNMVDLVGY